MPELARAADTYLAALEVFRLSRDDADAARARSHFEALLAAANSHSETGRVAGELIGHRKELRSTVRQAAERLARELATADRELVQGDASQLLRHFDRAITVLTRMRGELANELEVLQTEEQTLLDVARRTT